MGRKKPSELTELPTPASDDVYVIEDDSETDPKEEVKHIKHSNLFRVTDFLLFTRNGQTISSGAVTTTTNYLKVAAETGSTDDLDTVNGYSLGRPLIMEAQSGDTITVKDGTGNINCGSDFNLVGSNGDKAFFMCTAAGLDYIIHSNN